MSARVIVDDGEGGVNDVLVFAGAAAPDPIILIRDALIAGTGGRDTDEGLEVSVFGSAGVERRVLVEGWTVMLDPVTFALFDEYAGQPDFMNVALSPLAEIRIFPGFESDGTRIHFGTFDRCGNLIVAATDPNFAGGALTVTGESADGAPLVLSLGDDGFFRTDDPPQVPVWGSVLTVRARNPVSVLEGRRWIDS